MILVALSSVALMSAALIFAVLIAKYQATRIIKQIAVANFILTQAYSHHDAVFCSQVYGGFEFNGLTWQSIEFESVK